MAQGSDAAPAGEKSSFAPPPAAGSIATPAIRGSLWSVGGFAAGQLVRLGSNLILTRLLFPEVFGQIALVTVFIQGLHLFSDVGTGPAVVQSPRGDDPVFLDTAWTIQCIRGALLWLASWVIAWPVASFYGQPLLTWLIPAAGFNAMIRGFESLSPHTARRHLRLGRLTLVELGSQVAGIVANVLLVLLHRSLYGPNQPGAVWALIGGGFAYSAARVLLTFTALPSIRHRFLLDRGALATLYGFGRWVFFSTVLTFLGEQADRMVFGKAIPMELFGVYGIAAMLALLPSQAIVGLGASVVFPAFSRVEGRGDFQQLFWRVRLPLLVAGATLVSGLIASGPFLIDILYDQRYAEAGWILRYLAGVAWFQILESTNGATLLAQGRVAWFASGNATKLAGVLAFIPLGFHLGGFRGALVGLVLSDAAKYLLSVVAIARRGLRSLGPDVLLTCAVALVSAIGAFAGQAAAAGPHARLLGFLASGAVATAAWGALALGLLRRKGTPPAGAGARAS